MTILVYATSRGCFFVIVVDFCVISDAIQRDWCKVRFTTNQTVRTSSGRFSHGLCKRFQISRWGLQSPFDYNTRVVVACCGWRGNKVGCKHPARCQCETFSRLGTKITQNVINMMIISYNWVPWASNYAAMISPGPTVCGCPESSFPDGCTPAAWVSANICKTVRRAALYFHSSE